MKKAGLIVILALLVVSTAGCTFPASTTTPTPAQVTGSPSASPTPTVTYETTPMVTPAPTPAQASGDWLSGYTEKIVNKRQMLPDQVQAQFDGYYNKSDWSMPFPLGGPGVGASTHGAIFQVDFINPGSSTRTVELDYDIKATFSYFDQNGLRVPLVTADVFYDNSTGRQYTEVDVPPGATRSVYILGYISSDEDYNKYNSTLDTPSLDTNPRYIPA